MRRTLFVMLLLAISSPVLAESFEAYSLRMLVNDTSFLKYVSKNEDSERVKLTGVRLAERAKPGQRLSWRLDFEGGTRPEFAKVLCTGSATTGEFDVEFNMDRPIACRVERFQE